MTKVIFVFIFLTMGFATATDCDDMQTGLIEAAAEGVYLQMAALDAIRYQDAESLAFINREIDALNQWMGQALHHYQHYCQ